MSKNLKNISVVAIATVMSRVLGLVREMGIAAIFGTSALSSAFVSANTLPNLFRRLLGEGALTAAFVPTMTQELEHRHRDTAFALLSKVVSWLLVVTVAVVVVAMVVMANAESLLDAFGGLGMEPDTIRRLLMGADLAVILFPYMTFVCLAAAFSAACQVLGRFTEPALSPIWLNFAVLASLGLGSWWAWGDEARMHLLCAGVLFGGFLQMAVPAGVLLGEGWRPKFDLRMDERVREIRRLMAPTVLGSAVYLINISISRFIGLSLNDSATQVLNLATRVMELPIGVFAAAIATVVFPLIAKHAAKNEWKAMGVDYHKGLRLVLVANVPAAVGLALLSEPITRLLFQRGAFTSSDTALMTPILAVYGLGLPFLSFTTLALRGFYALKDTTTPVRAAILSFVVNLVLSIVLMQWLSTVGLALASNLAVLAQAWYLQTRLARKLPELGFAPLWPNLVKIVFASLVMGACVFAGAWAWQFSPLAGKAQDFAVLVTLIPLACAIYAGVLWVLRIEGREDFEPLIAKVRAKIPLWR
ncbi:murein biosynthesis integral membrane protein MurJ [Oleiharenicola lentus]|uniref:murein biosynthesis integral membrane protein MurJ n=1 Tax=Oleiharenicola lentus TaxID=2508720 RepID=UPI003F66B696